MAYADGQGERNRASTRSRRRVHPRLLDAFDELFDDGNRGEHADKDQNAMYRAPHTGSLKVPKTHW